MSGFDFGNVHVRVDSAPPMFKAAASVPYSLDRGAVSATDAPEVIHRDSVRGQGPAQGDHDFLSRHLPEQVVEVPVLDPMDIATGTEDGRNAAPDTMHSESPGLANETMPDGGVQAPTMEPRDPGFAPGPQKSRSAAFVKDLHDSYGVNDLDSVAFAAEPPLNPVAAAAIARGAVHVGGMTGAHFGESTDESLTPAQSVPVLDRPAFNVNQRSETENNPVLDNSLSHGSDVPVTPVRPVMPPAGIVAPEPSMYKPTGAPTETV
jgi:hypothetical protein